VLKREDITILGVPLAKICNENFVGVRNRILMKNIMYAGVACGAARDRTSTCFGQLLAESFGKKQALVDANMKAVQLGYDHAKAHLPCPLPLRVERMDKTAGHIMIDGNTAAGSAPCTPVPPLARGIRFTPSTSLMDAFKSFCARLRVDPETGKNNYAVIQAEDELSAIGMVLGANWNGARAFNGHEPVRHLADLSEFIGLAYYAEVPAVPYLRRAARRPLDRHADADAAVRHPAVRLCLTRRYQARAAGSHRTRRNASTWRSRRSTWPSGCRTPVFVMSTSISA